MNERARFWLQRTGGFFLTILGLCALGGLLGALLFPLAGRLGGSRKNHDEILVAGVKSRALIIMVWAPGAALVRDFMGGATARRATADDIAPKSRTTD